METTDCEHSSTLQPTPPACESTRTRTFVLDAVTIPGIEVTPFRLRPIPTDNGSRWITYASPERRSGTPVTLVSVMDSLSRFVHGAFHLESKARGEP
jgi:hypothetical protein